MNDKPIIFSGPMVRAILDGRKTQTRRILNKGLFAQGEWTDDYVLHPENAEWRERLIRWRVGDRLWVRETLRFDWKTNDWQFDADRAICVDSVGSELETPTPTRWPTGVCSPIHMPRNLSRLTLEVTDVRVQRLQEISEVDCHAEGVSVSRITEGVVKMQIGEKTHYSASAYDLYRDLWNSLHGPAAWDANPWVAAITFRVIANRDAAK